MNYGYFNDEKKEYVVTTPYTPIKWCNYVGTLQFGGIVDSTGGALLCKGDPALNRITKYIAQMPASDFKGSTVYVRVKENGEYKLFSPMFVPVLKELDKFENRVGMSYSTYVGEAYGVECEVTYFVPAGDQIFLQDIKVTNKSGKDLEIDVIPVIEYTHFDALKQLTNADWVPQTMTTEEKLVDGQPVLVQYAYMKKDTALNYYTASGEISSYDTDRRVFLGNNEYGSFANPLSLKEENLSNSLCVRGDNITALMLKMGVMANGATSRRVAMLGQEANISDIEAKVKKYRALDVVDEAFVGLANFWEEYLKTMTIDTPDESINSMLNVHNPRQCHTTKNWSRYLSLYQLGYGARGIGFRDSFQDLLGAISHMPQEGKEFASKLLSVQKDDGSAMHQFFPQTMEANEGDSREEPDRANYYGDDNLWMFYTVSQYVKETGDLAYLDEVIPYYKSKESGTVWDHLVRSITFTWNNRGQHGLPLLGFADWNDTVNLPIGAESVMVASMFGKACLDLMDLCDAKGEVEFKATVQGYYNEMKKVVNDVAWDKEGWYVRYFDHKGNKIGSSENTYGQIYTNAQSWAVMAGFAEGEKRDTALNSLNERLNTKYGIKLSTPGYNGYDEELGGVSTYPPGAKENGGIFLHSNPWVMIAETINGNGDRAFQYYNQINPAAKNDIIDIFESEPYCYPQNILGDEHKQFGLGRNAWLSGTSSWTYVAGTQYIIGVRPAFDGLIIDPCIPKVWNGFKASRKFRGAMYNIEVVNPNGVSKGVVKMVVDGKEVAGNKAPVFTSGEHTVVVTLG